MTTSPRWFSANPSRAWGEKFFLIYSPVWMAIMGLTMLLGWDKRFGDTALLIHALVVAGPLLVVPALIRDETRSLGRRWYQTYWFKANLYMAIFSFFGNYFGTEYFFDVLGMVYNYPNATTNLDAALLGSGEQDVPLIMYFYTHAYFMTYHTTAVLVLRRVMTSGLPGVRWLFPALVFAVGYAWAWMETKAMANPLMASTFYYEKMEAMLAYGSSVYALYFIGSFPIFYFLDEDADRPWSLKEVTFAGLGASMIVLYLLDFCTAIIGTL